MRTDLSNGSLSRHRRIAYVLISHFAVAVELRERPDLKGKPIVVGGEQWEQGEVFDASSEAQEHGVQRGIPLRQAEELCPEAIFLPPDKGEYQQAFSEVLKVLEIFSPKIEPEGLGCAYIDVTGCQRLFGEDRVLAAKIAQTIRGETGFSTSVGVAGTRFAARIAASCTSPRKARVLIPREEKRFLASFPVEILTEDHEMLRRLQLLEIETVGRYSTLPASDVAVQFGGNGRLAHQLALGMDSNHVVVRGEPPVLAEEIDFWEPIENLDELKLRVDALVERVASRLQRGGWMCGEVEVSLRTSQDRVRNARLALNRPTASIPELKGRVERLLQRQRHSCGVLGINISLGGLCRLDGKQLGLEILNIHQEERLWRIVSYLQARFGPERIRQAVLHDLCSLIPERRYSLLDYGTELHSG